MNHRQVSVRSDRPTLMRVEAASFAAEEYRAIALHVEKRLGDSGGRGYALAVSSCDAGAGKSLTSLNLALTLAQNPERRVLLVDGDTWHPSLLSYLDLNGEPGPGLLQAVREPSRLRESLVSVALDNGGSLDVMLSGGRAQPALLAAGRRLGQVVEEVRSLYDVTVFDCPPIFLAGARLLIGHLDDLLLVVRARRTTRTAIDRALSSVDKEKLLGFVLNDVGRHGLAYYRYRYPYGAEGGDAAPAAGRFGLRWRLKSRWLQLIAAALTLLLAALLVFVLLKP